MNLHTLRAFRDEISKIAMGVMEAASKGESEMLSKYPHLARHATPEAQLGHMLSKSKSFAPAASHMGAVRTATKPMFPAVARRVAAHL